jgi:hypothetical protein
MIAGGFGVHFWFPFNDDIRVNDLMIVCILHN